MFVSYRGIRFFIMGSGNSREALKEQALKTATADYKKAAEKRST